MIPTAVRFCLVAAALTTLLVADCADAQAVRRDDDGIGRLQAMVNQLTAEKAALERRNADLTTELEEAKQEIEKLRSANETSEARLGAAELSLQRFRQTNIQTSSALEQTRERMQELIGKFRETAELLRETEQDRNRLAQELTASREEYYRCAKDNIALYETGIEALEALENKGLLSVLGQKEPFTQIGRVRLENLVDEYKRELDDNRLPEAAAGGEAG